MKWARIETLKGIPVFSAQDPRIWTIEQVAEFADLVVKNQNIDCPISVADNFITQVCIIQFKIIIFMNYLIIYVFFLQFRKSTVNLF